MIKVVFFDAIDTLFKAYPDKIGMYCRSIKKVTDMNVSRNRMIEVWNKIVFDTEEAATLQISKNKTLAWDGFNERILELLKFTGDTRVAGKKLLYEAWSNPNNFVLYNDVLPTLLELEKRKLIIACISNENKYLYKFFVHFKIMDFFSFIIVSEEAKVEKPNPGIFLKACGTAKITPKEAIHVGDSLVSDYFGAFNVGMKAVLIDREKKVRDNDKVVTINKLTDVTRILEL